MTQFPRLELPGQELGAVAVRLVWKNKAWTGLKRVHVNFLQWLYHLDISTSVRESFSIFPALECVHIYSMIFLITIVAAFDLRLMGFRLGSHLISLAKLSKLVLRGAGLAIIVNFITGSFLFASKAPDYYDNSAFRVKILLIVAAVAYHAVLLAKARKWSETRAMSFGAKLAGSLSLIVWIGVIAASRWIAFT